jgi:hypothetical protein
MTKFHSIILVSCLAGTSFTLTACEKPAPPANKQADGHDHSKDDGHDHSKDGAHADGHTHGKPTPLGEQTTEGVTVAATLEGELKAGAEATFNCKIVGSLSKITAMRLWVGDKDAKGAIKAKAAIEGDSWHTHLEVQNPLPEGSKLWVELETEAAAKLVMSFDLK